MPLIQVFTSGLSPEPAARAKLLGELSRTLASHFQKPERWVMTCLVPELSMTFAGDPALSCFAAVKNVGPISKERAEALSEALGARLAESLGVPKDRIYIEFTESEGRLWGFDGATFG